MSDFDLKTKSIIKEEQLSFLSSEVQSFSTIDTEDEALFQQHVSQALNGYREGNHALFSPIPAVRHHLPFKEDTMLNFREAIADARILSKEQDQMGSFLVDSFNTVHSERKRLLERISNLNNLAGDLNLVLGNDTGAVTYFKESFQNTQSLDEDFSIEGVQKANISTKEGILTLGRLESVDLSETAKIAHLSGNGESGASHVSRKVTVKGSRQEEKEEFRFLSDMEKEYHSNPEVLLDSRPDTVFEYQMANVPESFKSKRNHYDFEWTKSAKTGDRLRMKLVIELKEKGPLNWVSLLPYFPYGSTGRLLLHSLKTSEDGFRYESVYQDHEVLDQEISESPQSYQLEELFNGNTDPTLASHTGQGVWVFPERTTKYIEIVLDQDQSYPEILAQDVYLVSPEGVDTQAQIPAPDELKKSEPGEYVRTLDGKRVTYEKRMDATTEGWRYAIGLRDIHLMQHTYATKSLFVSKKKEVEGEIKKVVLYANEIIPKEYQELVSEMNDWVTYEVSFDDSNWVRISPMHQEPVNDAFPPKILEVNGTAVDLTAAFQIHKASVKTEGAATSIRLRITLSRPDKAEFLHTTPIVEEVALKIERKEGL